MDGGPRSIAARAPLAYAEPPTLEREEQEVPGNADSAGGRARVEWRIAPRTTVYANALAYRFTQDGTDPLGEGALAVHGYAGAEQRFESGLSAGLSAGLRDESNADGSDRLSFVQLVADAAVPIRPGLAVGLKWDHRSETKVLFEVPIRWP